MVSVAVTSLVIWLVLVFLSVTQGIEDSWLKKLTSLHAPLRLHPTADYYSSYYYRIDGRAASSRYTLKTIGEKREALLSDPYNPAADPELPFAFPKKEERDLVGEVYALLEKTPQISYEDYEISGALLKVALSPSQEEGLGTHLSQMSYLLSYSSTNPELPSLLLKEALPLPSEDSTLEGVYLPKSYKDQGVVLGAKGSLNYVTQTAGSAQEQQIPIQVVGFYDPGLLPLGSKCVLVSKEVTRTLLASTQTFSPDGTPMNGIFIWNGDFKKAAHLKKELEEKLQKAGLSRYWKVTTYEEFPFAREFLQQFEGDRLLLLFIAALILFVACCNVFSFSILLASDKKREIATLRALGASKKSIAAIFALCGAAVGLASAVFGIFLAWITLENLPWLLSSFAKIQGSKLNPLLTHSALSSSLHWDTLLFLSGASLFLSTLAALLPALKASKIAPASALRSECF